LEAPIEDASALVPLNGYGQSKWVSERILEEAYQTRLLRTVNVRVGQVTGGINGSWNTFEWFPSLIKSGSILGCLPGGEDVREVLISFVIY
jgi:thioester reductase-like protein